MNPITIGIGDIAAILQCLRAAHSTLQARKDNLAALELIVTRSSVLYEVLAQAPEGANPRAVQHLYEALCSVKRATDEYKAAVPLKRFLFAMDYKDMLAVAGNQISAVAGDLNLSLAVRQANKYDSTVADVQAAIMVQLQEVLDQRSESIYNQLELHVRDVPEALAALKQRLEKSEARANELDKLLHETLLHIHTSVVRHSAIQQPALSADAKALDRLAVTSYDFDYADPRTALPLGKGSFGEVVQAVWKATGTAVAIKRLLPFQGSNTANDQTATSTVAKEALVWSRLQHPHILPLLGVCLLADIPFLVMPLMSGGDLPAYTKDKSAHDQLRALHETAQGIAYLHSQNIFHGDLKGNNVLVDEYGRVQVSDFGQSRVLSMAGSRVSTFGAGSVGNVRWIAPERYEHGANYQFEPDVFGFAMIMYEVLSSGKIPFQDDWRATDDVIREWYRQGTRPKVPAQGLEKFGPVDVWEVVTDCWLQDWRARPTMVMVVRKLAALMIMMASVPVAAATIATPPCETPLVTTRELPAPTSPSNIDLPPAYDDIHPPLRADSAVANVFTPPPAPSPAALADSIASLALDASSARTPAHQPQPIPANLFTAMPSPHPTNYPLATYPDTFATMIGQSSVHSMPPLSLATLDRGLTSSADSSAATTGPLNDTPHTFFEPKVSMDPSVPAAVVCMARAKFAYAAAMPEEISFVAGEHLSVLEQHPDGWWTAEQRDPNIVPGGVRRGLIPSNYVDVVWLEGAKV